MIMPRFRQAAFHVESVCVELGQTTRGTAMPDGYTYVTILAGPGSGFPLFHLCKGQSEELLLPSADRVCLGLQVVSVDHLDHKAIGRHFDVTARSVMPDSAPESKIEAVRGYGGTPVLVPMSEVFRYMREHLWEDEPYAFVHPWTNRDVMIGHASLALEILEDCPQVDSIFVPVGGGGLIDGVGTAITALKPDTKVVAVEPAGCASLHDSIAAGEPVSVECDTICDGVAVPYMTEEMFPLLRDVVDEVVLVSEADVKAAVKRLAVGN
jgi:hypothetical protein